MCGFYGINKITASCLKKQEAVQEAVQEVVIDTLCEEEFGNLYYFFMFSFSAFSSPSFVQWSNVSLFFVKRNTLLYPGLS